MAGPLQRWVKPADGLKWIPSAEIPRNARHSSTTQAGRELTAKVMD